MAVKTKFGMTVVVCGLLGGGIVGNAEAQGGSLFPPNSPLAPRTHSTTRRPTNLPLPFGSQPVTLDMTGDFRQAISALMQQGKANYVYALRTFPVNKSHVQIKRMPLNAALRVVLLQYPVSPPLRSIQTRNIISLAQPDPPGSPATFKTRRLTLQLKNVPLPDAFRSVFAALGTQYILDPAAQGRATLSLRDASYKSVLDALARQSVRPLTIRERNNAILILPRKP